jgi:peptide/nickel transport system substrate-binding protein
MKRRHFLQAGTAAAAATALPRISIAQPASANTLSMVPQANLTLLDPIFTTAAVTVNYAYNVYDTLFAVNAKMEAKPQMAEGYTVSDDGRTWLIKLREGLKFHDGEPVRAQDAAPSLARWAARDTFGQTVATFVDAWEAADDRTVRVKLKEPFPLLVDALAKPQANVAFVMPERSAKVSPNKAITENIGSGPYKFVDKEFIAGSHAAFEKFDGYVPRQEVPDWTSGGKVAHMRRVEWKIIPDAATAAAALQSGEVDWWEQVLPDLNPVLKNTGQITIDVCDPTGYVGVARFNCINKPFDNAALRRAVMMAINQQDYMEGVTAGDASAWRTCKALFPCGTPYGVELAQGKAAMPGDLTAATAAVKAAGYNGEKIVIINPTDFPTIGPFGEITADLLRRMGMNVELQAMDWGSVVQRRSSRNPVADGGWSIFHTWWPSVSILNPVLSAILRGQGGAGWFGWFKDDKIEQLTQDFLRAKTQADRLKITDAIQTEAFQQAPTIPLGQFVIRTAYRSNIRGVLKGPAPMPWNVTKG